VLSMLLALGHNVPGQFIVWDKLSQLQRDAIPMTPDVIAPYHHGRGSVRTDADGAVGLTVFSSEYWSIGGLSWHTLMYQL
jgi:hypothetical protein